MIGGRPGFTGSPIDRRDALRQDSDRLADALAHAGARFLPLAALDPHLLDQGLRWLTAAELPEGAEPLFLGFEDDAPRFCVNLAADSLPHAATPVFQALAGLSRTDGAIYAQARSLADWHRRHGFCPRCGHETAPDRGGWMRRCTNCGTEHFPRTDPVVIMLVEHDDRVLLGRQAGFPPNRYSALAGFLEVGESIEEAVAREVQEEAGIAVDEVRYVMSQPWPFPSQLMIGCFAKAQDDRLDIDPNELEEAFWASRSEIEAALAETGRFGVAPPFALANSLLQRWAYG